MTLLPHTLVEENILEGEESRRGQKKLIILLSVQEFC